MMVTAAVFAREQIEDQSLAAAQGLVVLTPAVRIACVAPLGKDHAGVFQIVIQQGASHEAAQGADGQGVALRIADEVIHCPMTGDKIPGGAQCRVGPGGDAANALHFVGIARHGRLVQKRHATLAAKVVTLQVAEFGQELDEPVRGRRAVNADAARIYVQALQGALPHADLRAITIAAIFLQQLRPAQVVPADGLQAAVARLFDLHGVDEQHGRGAAALDHQAAGDAGAIGQIITLDAVEFIAHDDNGLQFARGHQLVQVRFHGAACLRSNGVQSIVFACACQPKDGQQQAAPTVADGATTCEDGTETRAALMRFSAILLLVLLVLTPTGLVLAQTDTLNGLTLAEPLAQTGCNTAGTVFTTLNLQKWHAYTFFWVGTQMPPADLSLRFCDVNGNVLADQGDNASILRGSLALDHEVDGFLALEDLSGVTVRLNSDETLELGDYVMRHWTFESSIGEQAYRFPAGYTLVTACGNETNDRNGVAVDLQAGRAYEFTGNEFVSELAICEQSGQSYIIPQTHANALRENDETAHVFHVRTSADQNPANPADAVFTLTTHTPGDVIYPGMMEEDTTPQPVTPSEPVVDDEHFATLGSMAQLHYVELPDGINAVDVYSVSDEGRGEQILRVDQVQVDGVVSGLVVATGDDRLVVSVSSADIITFAMGPDDEGRVYYLEMDEGLAGPISASSSRQGSPPGEAWS